MKIEGITSSLIGCNVGVLSFFCNLLSQVLHWRSIVVALIIRGLNVFKINECSASTTPLPVAAYEFQRRWPWAQRYSPKTAVYLKQLEVAYSRSPFTPPPSLLSLCPLCSTSLPASLLSSNWSSLPTDSGPTSSQSGRLCMVVAAAQEFGIDLLRGFVPLAHSWSIFLSSQLPSVTCPAAVSHLQLYRLGLLCQFILLTLLIDFRGINF